MAQAVLAFAPPAAPATDPYGLPTRRPGGRLRHGASGVDFSPTGELRAT